MMPLVKTARMPAQTPAISTRPTLMTSPHRQCLAHRRCRVLADDGRPRSDLPARDETIRHVGIGLRKAPRQLGRVALEQHNTLVRGICERATQNKLATLVCAPGIGEMQRAEGAPALEIVGDEVVEQQEMHEIYETRRSPGGRTEKRN